MLFQEIENKSLIISVYNNRNIIVFKATTEIMINNKMLDHFIKNTELFNNKFLVIALNQILQLFIWDRN